MAIYTKLSVTVPDGLLEHVAVEMRRTGKSRSAVISEILRAHYEPTEPDSSETFWDLSGEIAQLDKRLARIEQMAQESGAV